MTTPYYDDARVKRLRDALEHIEHQLSKHADSMGGDIEDAYDTAVQALADTGEDR